MLGNGAGAPRLVEQYVGAPNYTFTNIGGSTVMRLPNTLTSWTRCGWSSATTFHGQTFRYEVRFNTLTQGAGTSIDVFLEIWILDAANSNRFDVMRLDTANYGAAHYFIAGSSIDTAYNQLPFNFQDNTWYRLVLSAGPNQGCAPPFSATPAWNWSGFPSSTRLRISLRALRSVCPNAWGRLMWRPRWTSRWIM